MIKTSILSVVLLMFTLNVSAKKVKFSVDMTGQTISAAGVHIVGDFQSEAGLGADFAQLTPMIHETGSIYSLVVNIPAFRKYEYKFANGDLFYEVEFVPIESRVGYDQVDNRWMYVDSLRNDTSFVGAILYGGNAPAGLTLVRSIVNMTGQSSVNTTGVHVAGSFQSWSTTQNILYSFVTNVYETIFYVANGSCEYKFYNGNAVSNSETVPSICATNGNRSINVTKDTVLNTVCYASCAACLGTSVKENVFNATVKLFPNPSVDKTTLEFSTSASREITLTDITGKIIRTYTDVTASVLVIEKGEINTGIYFLKVLTNNSGLSVHKLIFN